MPPVSETELRLWGRILSDSNKPLVERFRALWGLKHAQEDLAIDLIAEAFSSKSELLKHELAYCLGQKANTYAIKVLTDVLENDKQEPIVRHEAGEALAAIGEISSYDILKKYSENNNKEIAETCYIGFRRLEYFQTNTCEDIPSNEFDTIDPAPEYPINEKSLEELRKILLTETEDIFERYRALFSLRRLANSTLTESVDALNIICEGLRSPSSGLFRHEVAFVLGQLANPLSTQALHESLANTSELGMVRHESAEALGAIGNDECQKILESFLDDKEQVVLESCVVALDVAHYNACENFDQYALVPQSLI